MKLKNGFRKGLATLLALVLAALAPLSVTAETAQSGEAPAEPAAAAAEPSAEPVLTGSRVARVFPATLDSTYTLTTWSVEGETDVPYVSLRELVNVLYAGAYQPDLSFAWDGNVYVITNHGESIYADLDAQTVQCANWRAFRGPSAPGAVPAGIIDKDEFLAIRPSEKNESTQTEGQGYEIRLADYSLRMIRHEEEVLLPFAAAQNIFGGPFMMGVLGYNGEDYFDLVDCFENIYGTKTMTAAPNPYADKWFSGPFATQKEISEAYAAYNYHTMCLLLDLTFGHKEEMGIQSMDSYLEAQGLKAAFLNSDPMDDGDALKVLFNKLFDSGHDAQILSRSIFDSDGIPGKAAAIHDLLDLIGYDSVGELEKDLEPLLAVLIKILSGFGFDPTETTPSDEKSELGPNVNALMASAMQMMILKPLLYGKNRVDIVGDTCVIYFESFQEDLKRSESFYTKVPTRADIEQSTFALAYYAFEQIKKDGNVKKVVFDLSNNGGGSAAALVSVLGFLTEDGEVHITYRDLLDKTYVSEYYHVDTNLDGNFDDRDGYGGEYDFYILTSGYSYSCGNAMPYFAQQNKLAKIIGKKPGGGDCVVAYYVDATGHVGANSGFLQLGTMEGDTFVSDETAVEMDLPFSDEDVKNIFFHPDKIAEAIAERDR